MKPRLFPALPDPNDRVETGPIQFGDDWPGTFIRGDCSFYYAMHLAMLLDDNTDEAVKIFSKMILRGLLSDLQNSDVRTHDKEESNDGI